MAAGITLEGMCGMSCSKLNALFKWGSGRGKKVNFSLWNQTESKILFTCRSRLLRGSVSSCCFPLYTIWKQSNFIHSYKSLWPFKRCQSWTLIFIHHTKKSPWVIQRRLSAYPNKKPDVKTSEVWCWLRFLQVHIVQLLFSDTYICRYQPIPMHAVMELTNCG